MSIMVRKLYKSGTFLYNMKLIAGKNGLNNLVQWVHIIEDASVISFLHGNELVFTAGILNNKTDWLLNFAIKLSEANAGAFVVNIGPHTNDIPEDVINYCNDVNLPLFTIPWETKMVDMTRDFCQLIMNHEQVEINLASTIKNIIFNVGDFETQVLQVERYGYQRDSKFCFISLTVGNDESFIPEEQKDILKMIAERTAKSIHELYISFTYKGSLIIVLVNYIDTEIESFVHDFLTNVKFNTNICDLHLGISSNQIGLYNQNRNFEKAVSAMKMAFNLNEQYCYYDKLGVYKVLYATNDMDILRNFYKDTIGKLEVYDRQNETKLAQLLRTYFENNGSLQLVSEKLYIHRNTVTNQLKKIESVTGYNPLDLEDRVSLYIGFYIKDIL